MIAIGIDTGGTCTDAVIYDTENRTILASAKSPTTHEALEIGIGQSIRKLPHDLAHQAIYISLSTTLATNACVENKGGRVCLVFIGTPRKTLEETYKSYGFDGMEFMRFLDGDPSQKVDPDWDAFEAMLPEIFENYDSIAITQLLPRLNDGAFEKEAYRRIKEKKDVPVICGYNLFKEVNTIKRGAGALLNARLIPVIETFFKAVNKVLAEEHFDIPLVIMRSDGSLVSEKYSSLYPVETLLCGPTASVKGGMELMNESNSVIIDIGGTTSDIALVKGGEPVVDEDGVMVGQWKTLVRGIAVDTFALGGDTRVRYRDLDLYLGNRRVIPISSLATKYPLVEEELRDLVENDKSSSIPLHEHLILMEYNDEKSYLYSDKELVIIDLLKAGPLSIRQLSRELGIDPYILDTERLEDEGVIMRSGITPTDAMIIKGDFVSPGIDAAKYAMRFLEKCMSDPYHPREVDPISTIYYLVKEKLYVNLVRILWQDAHKTARKLPDSLESFAKEAFAAFMAAKDDKDDGEMKFYSNTFHTDASLVGVGAPTHVFLQDVADALGTKCCLSKYSGVTNALGAMLGDVCTYETVPISFVTPVLNPDVDEDSYRVFGDVIEDFLEKEDAISRAAEIAKKRAAEKALLCGAKEITEVTVTAKDRQAEARAITVYFGTDVIARAKGRLI